MNIEQLNTRFGKPGIIEFKPGQGGLTQAHLTSPSGRAAVYLHGAHVSHFQPAGRAPVLWMSQRSLFQDGKPIRGGVPVCFPWFSNSIGIPDAPGHGFVRLTDWDVEDVRVLPDGQVQLTLATGADPRWEKFWKGQFKLRHIVTVGGTLTMTLETRNVGSDPFKITEALHAYFAISDIRQVRVLGLERAKDLHNNDSPPRPPIRFSAEYDRDYMDTTDTVIIEDPGMHRRIVIAKEGSRSTVVWNPWIAKAARMQDFDDNEWPTMLCVETANVEYNAVTLAAGQTQAMTARIYVDDLS